MAGKEVAVKKGTSLTNWQDRLANMAKESTQQEASVATGQFLSTKAGQLTWQGSPVQGNKLEVIVLDAVIENAYYPEEYDPDNPQPPTCFAFGRDERTMKPHPDSADAQSEACAGCKNNEFGTAIRGKGKACKNIRRLGLIAAKPLSADGVQKSEVAFLKTPVTSVKGWASYVRTLETLRKRPPAGVVTEISTIPDPKSQYKIVFNYLEDLPDEVMGAVMDRHEEVKASIDFPYSPPNSEPAPKPAARSGKPAAAAAAGRRKY